MPTGFDIRAPQTATVVTPTNNLLEQNQAILRSLNAEKALYPYYQFGPMSDAADLNILINEPLHSAANELSNQEDDLDKLQEKLLSLTNTLTTLKESCEEQLALTRDQATTLSLMQQDENLRQYWYVETFDSPFKTDGVNTTCLVDTTYSYCSLSVLQNEAIGEVTYELDRPNSIGLPGTNMELKSKGLRGMSTAPAPTFEKDILPCTDLGAMNDGDPTSRLEWERCFIYKPQQVAVIGHDKGPYVAMTNGTKWIDPLSETKYDWTTHLQWPGDIGVDTGNAGKGYATAEFISRSSEITNTVGKKREECRLVIVATLPSPQPISMLVITPLIYGNARPTVERLEVTADGINWILVGKNDSLGERALSASEQTRVADLKKGSGSAIYMIPTNRPIIQVKVTITGGRYSPPEGFGHKFTAVYKHERVEQQILLWSSVSNSYWWERCPSDKIPVNTISKGMNPIIGTVLGTIGIAVAAANAFKPSPKKTDAQVLADSWKSMPTGPGQLPSNGLIGNSAGRTQPSTTKVQPGDAAGQAAATSGQKAMQGATALNMVTTAVPKALGSTATAALGWVGAALAVYSLAETFFGRTKTVTIEKMETGVDIFEGERSYISLRELNLVRSQYQAAGEYFSRAIDFPESVSQVALFVTEQVPDEWPLGDWIRYYISTDQSSWSEITPLSIAGNNKGTAYIVPEGASPRFYFKATFSRPQDDSFRSPILLHYSLQGIVADGAF